MNLNGWNVTLAEKKTKFMSLQENEDRSILSAAKYTPMMLVSKNIRYMRIFTGRGSQIQYMLPCYLRHNSQTLCLCEIIPWVLLTYSVGVHWGVARVCSGVQRALPAPSYTPWMPIKGSNIRVGFVYCYHYATLAVNNDDGSNWEWLRDYLSALTMRSHWVFLVLVTLQTKTNKKWVLWQRNYTMPL